nr:immunoglobulin heavy chain junction region [Macaca mulatta]MOX37925.1 immunoglobulin heavy chain junction region [Macaca mulatta]MOX38470.1 immunoglobulin heavy chain junction region [Macaca mulatta]MOX38821.1 immunoglobulin heavy chain junction region [Macaca mulatta]MOX40936.1 immunoglobulin heavy chain junction region [Macaca mulatta]
CARGLGGGFGYFELW